MATATEEKPDYGERYIEWAEIASEVEVIIGIVTVSLIIIYGGGFWVAVGTAVGFIVLECFTLLVVAVSWNVVALRKELDGMRRAMLTSGLVTPESFPVPAPSDEDDEDEEEDTRTKVLRMLGISASVIAGIVLVRWFLGA